MKFDPKTYDLEGEQARVAGSLLHELHLYLQANPVGYVEFETTAKAIRLAKEMNKFRRAYAEQSNDTTYGDINITVESKVTPPRIKVSRKKLDTTYTIRGGVTERVVDLNE